eukprot:7149360-Lingulodinium_polyedra.AAC.1
MRVRARAIVAAPRVARRPRPTQRPPYVHRCGARRVRERWIAQKIARLSNIRAQIAQTRTEQR